MNVTHIIDKLREKYKDDDSYWTKEDIIKCIEDNDEDFYFGMITKNFCTDFFDKDFFGISPYFIFIKDKYSKKQIDDEYLNRYSSENVKRRFILKFFKDSNDDINFEESFYEVYSLIPYNHYQKKLFSKGRWVTDYLKVFYEKGVSMDNKKLEHGKYHPYQIFDSYILGLEGEFIKFLNFWRRHEDSGSNRNLNKLCVLPKKKLLLYQVPSDYDYQKDDWFNVSQFKREYNIEKQSVPENLTHFSLSNEETIIGFWEEFYKNCKKEYNLFLNSKKESISKNKNEIIETIDKFIKKYDSDKNDEIDLFEEDNGLSELLKKHQKKIIEIDRSYIQNFVKMNEYIKTKKSNCIQTFNLIKQQLEEYKEIDVKSYEGSDEENYKEDIKFFKSSFEDLIQTYRLLVLHSLSMITSLVNDDMITFYEIYEILDKLGIFNSNHENLIEDKLSNIETSLGELISSINQMEKNIVKGLDKLTYVTESSFKDLNKSIVKELQGIDSKLGFNNLLTSINTYQTYKLRK